MSAAEYIKVLRIGKCRINAPAERKAVKSKKKSGTGRGRCNADRRGNNKKAAGNSSAV